MKRIEYLKKLISKYGCKVCLEVGVWKGETSFQLCTTPTVEKYYMVDPLCCDYNSFKFTGDDHPSVMEEG